MSKKTNTAVKPLSENTRRAIIITAIIVVAVIILSVSLALILKPNPVTPPDNDPSSTGSSSLTIRNGDFYYTSSDDTAYPKTAQNWTKYAYKEATSSSHGFDEIDTSRSALMGIVTTATEGDGDTWSTVAEDLAADGLDGITNPGTHSDELSDNNVYIIAAKEATTASILSDSFSVSSGKSVKITLWLNTAQLKNDSKAVIMIQKSTVSAQAENWYAYDFEVGHDASKEDDNGWQQRDFYIFNRDTGTKYIRVSIGLGNVYSGEEGLELGEDKQPINGEGVLFVDDITYTEVNANEYRTTVDGDAPEHSFKVIENEDIEDESKYFGWKDLTDKPLTGGFTEADAAAAELGDFSPFTDRDDFFKDNEPAEGEEVQHNVPTGFTIYKLSHDGSAITESVGVRMDISGTDLGVYNGNNGGINTAYNMWQKDHHHISFWLRAKQINAVAQPQIFIQSYNEDEGKWEDVDSWKGSSLTFSQEIETDANCGWIKFDIFLKPDTMDKEISILVTLGNKDSYTDKETGKQLFPNGTLYLTSPAYERISSKDYNNASSGTYSKKIDLIGEAGNTSITNGTFSTLNNTAQQPTGWTQAFAGDNMLYRDGRGDLLDSIERNATSVAGSQTLRNSDLAPLGANELNLDDEQRNILRVQNNAATSFGYFSNEITLSARTVYVFSALVKADETARPHFYMLSTDTTLERADRVIGEGKVMATNEAALGQNYASSEYTNGWTRRYIIIVTGNESIAVRLALFNGDLDGTEKGTGCAYFDQVQMSSLGSYSTATDSENEDAEKYIVNWNMSDYKLNDESLTIKDLLSKQQVELLVKVGAITLDEGETAAEGTFASLCVADKQLPSEDDWNTMLKVPETTDDGDTDDGDEEETTTTREPVDLGLLFSVISSVALVAALLVVLVVKIFKNRKNNRKAA